MSFIKNIKSIGLLSFSSIMLMSTSVAQSALDDLSASELIAKINQDPNNLSLHEAYLKASGFTKWGVKEDPAFINQYKKWMKQNPKSAVLPYALGHAYAGKESPRAKPYLLKAVQLDPSLDLAYFDLWIDAERWGQFDQATDYLKKASEIKPDNADYAFFMPALFLRKMNRKNMKS